MNKKAFNELFDLLLSKLEQNKGYEVDYNEESQKIVLKRIVSILLKINETIITDLSLFSSDNKDGRSNSDFNINNIAKLKDFNYFDDNEADDNNIKKQTKEDLIDKDKEANNTDVYLSFFDIYEKILPFILEFYANEQHRPKRKIASTYKNCEIEILGIFNISIVELIKSFFEMLCLNSKNKAFGYKNIDENSYLIEKKFAIKLKFLFEIFLNNNFFKVCLLDLLKYEMNNHLQFLFKSIISFIFDYSHKQIDLIDPDNIDNEIDKSQELRFCANMLIDHLLIELGLLDFIVLNTLDKTIEFDNSKTTINSGTTACLVETAEIIDNAKYVNDKIQKFLNEGKNNKSKFLILSYLN